MWFFFSFWRKQVPAHLKNKGQLFLCYVQYYQLWFQYCPPQPPQGGTLQGVSSLILLTPIPSKSWENNILSSGMHDVSYCWWVLFWGVSCENHSQSWFNLTSHENTGHMSFSSTRNGWYWMDSFPCPWTDLNDVGFLVTGVTWYVHSYWSIWKLCVPHMGTILLVLWLPRFWSISWINFLSGEFVITLLERPNCWILVNILCICYRQSCQSKNEKVDSFQAKWRAISGDKGHKSFHLIILAPEEDAVTACSTRPKNLLVFEGTDCNWLVLNYSIAISFHLFHTWEQAWICSHTVLYIICLRVQCGVF